MDQPSFIRRLLNALIRLFRSAPPQPTSPPENHPPNPAPGDPPLLVTPKISLVIYNPTIPQTGGRRLAEVLGWNDPDRLVAQFIADLREVSHGYVNYAIAERIEIDEFPLKEDGFRYSAEEYMRCIRAGRGFHQPDAVNYELVLQQSDLVSKIQSGAIDEVWTISFPYAGFYESRMAGPGAFWCNAPPLDGFSQAGRRFVIMAFNYERGVGEMLESYGHRVESIMTQVFRNSPGDQNLWQRFTRYDKIAPGRAEVGSVHFAPNSQKDYDWGNPTPVLSRSRTWQSFPDLSGDSRLVDSQEWGGGDIRAHHRWWLSLLPHQIGHYGGISYNWWEYIIDPNRVH